MKMQVTIALGAFVLGCGLLTQAQAAAIAPCTGTAGPASASLATSTDGSTFVRNAMNFKCSNNVWVSADQDSSKAWVAAASRKGKFYWGGNTDGGSAAKLGTAEVSPGTDPTPGTQLDTAKTAGTSS